MTISMEWHEFHYPRGRSGRESVPQFVAYLSCAALCDVDMSAEVVEVLDGLGGFMLSRYHCYGYAAVSRRTFDSWHPTVDAAYLAAGVWAERRAKEVEIIDCDWDDEMPEWIQHAPSTGPREWSHIAQRHAEYRAAQLSAGEYVPFGYPTSRGPEVSSRNTRLWVKQQQG